MSRVVWADYDISGNISDPKKTSDAVVELGHVAEDFTIRRHLLPGVSGFTIAAALLYLTFWS